MRLLILTQKVDINDANLGFFHRWIEEFAKHCELIVVVCLQKGEYHLPANVRVLSLGKETKPSRVKYLWNFYKYIILERRNYDAVFVHMNKEYVLLGGLLWKMWHKKIALWYTHKAVSWQLKLAEKIVDKIFTASKESFRLPSKKVEITGHGIPVEIFAIKKDEPMAIDLWLLSVGRITVSKDLETIIKAVGELLKLNTLPSIRFSIVGNMVTSEDRLYQQKIESLAKALRNRDGSQAVGLRCKFFRYEEMPDIYQRYHVLIHTSRTGSIDKVVLEALASGRLVITSSEAFADLAKEGLVYTFPQGDYQELAKTIEKIYNSGIILPNKRGIEFVRKNHNLENVISKISDYFKRS